MKRRSVHSLVFSACIAALYCTLTLAVASFGFGPVQFRLSEALTVLPMLTPAAIPGLFVGCALANIIGSPIGLADVVFGSLASLSSAYFTWKLRDKTIWIALIPPVIINAVVIGLLLYFYQNAPLGATILSIGCGQLTSCYALGIPLYYLMQRTKTLHSLLPE